MTRLHWILLVAASTLVVLSHGAPAPPVQAKPATSESTSTQTEAPSTGSQGTQTEGSVSSSSSSSSKEGSSLSRGDIASAFAGLTGVGAGATALGVAASKCGNSSNCRRAVQAKEPVVSTVKATGDYGKILGGALAVGAGGLTAADYFGGAKSNSSSTSKRSQPDTPTEQPRVLYYIKADQ